ncbi:P-II family nitrogen regulator [Paenibacillus sp. HN-1]|uniref:P-II family nitrogen regulator n=1 Tax=Paenibacillus TaxID=44249 RepID=UPI001CA975CB|nr:MULTISPECIES: P-II family nitrogen regulator [Paenibacillus]MBY9080112.1 P-II family nitrogen regulator [Paenibacillus sp. CGMCC 1.18879]MBY9086810.1 P-II family nitrogen regulator [Paenibacillus sinensis]
MLMLEIVVRPEKADEVMEELLLAGFPSISKMDILGRGKQKGIQVGTNHYNQISKKMLMMVIHEDDKEEVVDIVKRTARTGDNGSFGDGKIFVLPVLEAYTISTGKKEL